MANERLHTAPARIQAILDELDRVAAEYAGAQRERSPALFAPGLTLKRGSSLDRGPWSLRSSATWAPLLGALVGKWDDWALDDACERGRTWVNFPKYNTTQMQPHEQAQGFTDVSDRAARLEREARRNGQPMTRAAPRASLLLAVCLLASAATAHAECAWGLWKQASVKNPAETFPPSAVTTQDKIDWLTAEADLAAQAVDAEAEKPLPQQREALYRATLACGADLIRLINTIAERLPRLEARVNETMTRTIGGLERIANGRLKIGMSAEQVRQIRGEPSGISEMTTAVGVRQQWQYGATVLLFNNGKLVEIRQMLNE